MQEVFVAIYLLASLATIFIPWAIALGIAIIPGTMIAWLLRRSKASECATFWSAEALAVGLVFLPACIYQLFVGPVPALEECFRQPVPYGVIMLGMVNILAFVPARLSIGIGNALYSYLENRSVNAATR